MNYTTVDKLKTFLKIEDSSKDALLEEIIKTTTKFFDKHLGYNLGEKTYGKYLWEIYGEYVLFPPITPIKDVEEVRVNEEIIPVKRFIEDIVYLYGYVSWEVFIKYKAWYSSLEEIADVEQACLEVCKEIYSSYKDKKTLLSKSIWDISMSFREKESNFLYNGVLRRYSGKVNSL